MICLFCGSDEYIPFRKRADIVQCCSDKVVYLRTKPTLKEMYQIYQLYANSTSYLRAPINFCEVKKPRFRGEYFVKRIIEVQNDKKLDEICTSDHHLAEISSRIN